ncbi:dihydrodipicolinate synthase family protein [Arthrobacter mobilis]|uniref:Dihydrodipicolinate synthase family protein n=1 Tax=Arthrobacter mobilis TaxID=2724944 RepID=A0A7X6HE42_9MICC|nr:dihydrodipicolinate synthase family protein [Arthrobacter mobilis]NKX55438.1 dihydrodipicolinate synthase family protein [Arthrobacter mobilis]
MFDGLCAFPLTPVSEDGLDEAAFVHLVSRIAAAGVASIGVLGSTGIYPYLSRGERRTVLEAAVGAAGGTPVIAGIGALRTRDVLAHVEDAQAAGAAALLLAPVSYQRLTEEEVYGLYRDVSEASSVPVVVYDNPTTTAFTFTDELHGRIAALPRIAAIKIPPPPAGTAAGRVAKLRKVLPDRVSVGISGDWAAAEALLGGCDGWYSVIAGVLPGPAQAIADAALGGRADAAGKASAALEPLWALFRAHGSLRVAAAIAADLGLVTDPCLPLPLRGLDEPVRAEVRDALRLAGVTG